MNISWDVCLRVCRYQGIWCVSRCVLKILKKMSLTFLPTQDTAPHPPPQLECCVLPSNWEGGGCGESTVNGLSASTKVKAWVEMKVESKDQEVNSGTRISDEREFNHKSWKKRGSLTKNGLLWWQQIKTTLVNTKKCWKHKSTNWGALLGPSQNSDVCCTVAFLFPWEVVSSQGVL